MGISRKTWALFAVAAIAALAFALPAFASVGDSGYLTWDSMGGANGTSPHGGYSTTTQKCVVCHAVHNADGFGELLLRGSVADACTYCHVGGGGGYTQVYEGVVTNYSGTDYDNAHNTFQVASVDYGVKCTTCHSVHAAATKMTNNAYLTSRLLVGSKTFTGNEYDSFAQAPLSTDSSDTALTKWCTACHDAGLGTGNQYYNGADWAGGTPDMSGVPNLATAHVMTSDTASYDFPDGTTGQVAWLGSEQCASCHASGYRTSAWPHFTPGARFLVSAASAASVTPTAAVDAQADGVCLRCHVSGGGAGVGLNW
ncbi:MAG: hypothetical protein U1E26_04470 [Coriobacteriia bacterium]|nr:hypothetical protein [Coriobacteriia bacterium]